jgi:hypothetical protein
MVAEWVSLYLAIASIGLQMGIAEKDDNLSLQCFVSIAHIDKKIAAYFSF